MQEAPLMLKNKTARRIKDIPGFVFPGGVKVIINFTVDFDAMIFRKFLREPKLWCAQGEFGGRTGLWRLLDVFGEFDVRTTLADGALISGSAPARRAGRARSRQSHVGSPHPPDA